MVSEAISFSVLQMVQEILMNQQRSYCLTASDTEDKSKTLPSNHGLQHLSNYMK